jgi:hypothetical protein
MERINSHINELIENRDKSMKSYHIASFVPTKNTNFNVVGINSNRMPRSNNNITTHAEVMAILNIENCIRCKRTKHKHMDLVVIRVDKSGNLRESAPCHHCTLELMRFSLITISKLYYSNSNGEIVCMKFSDWLSKDVVKNLSSGYKHYQNKSKNKGINTNKHINIDTNKKSIS